MKKIIYILLLISLIFSCATMSISDPAEVTINNMYDDYYEESYYLSVQESEIWKSKLDDAHYLFDNIIRLNDDGQYNDELIRVKRQIYNINKSFIERINSQKMSKMGQSMSNIQVPQVQTNTYDVYIH